ncbi:MAG: DUF481 domain-containing protein [Polyangiaceae bacterium]|nr:DUF481 domain-containing protein [Polyangiaceae bacterium]
MSRRTSLITLITASFTALGALPLEREALAQVNAESLRQNPLKPGLSINTDITFALAKGNVELFDIGAGGKIQYQTLYPLSEAAPTEAPTLPFIRQRVFIAGNGRYADRADIPVVSQSYLHMRWTGMWHPRIGTDTFIQYQYNRFFRLLRRSLAGAGARVDMFHHPNFLWWGGSAYMLEYEMIAVAPGASDTPETLSHRWTNYLTERVSTAGDRIVFQSTTYIQPRFDNFSDFRLLEEVEALGKVTDMVSFGLNFSLLYDSAPPTGVKNTDVRLSSAVHLNF